MVELDAAVEAEKRRADLLDMELQEQVRKLFDFVYFLSISDKTMIFKF